LRRPRRARRAAAKVDAGGARGGRDDERGVAEPGHYLEHDEAGNIARIVDPLGGVTTQTFDAHGRLVEPRESPHAVTDGSGNEQLGYVFAGEHPLFRYDHIAGEPAYYLEDSISSVIGLVGDDVAAEQSTIHYNPFGNEREVSGTPAALPSASAGELVLVPR
jgi:YD repeat-containing protein